MEMITTVYRLLVQIRGCQHQAGAVGVRGEEVPHYPCTRRGASLTSWMVTDASTISGIQNCYHKAKSALACSIGICAWWPDLKRRGDSVSGLLLVRTVKLASLELIELEAAQPLGVAHLVCKYMQITTAGRLLVLPKVRKPLSARCHARRGGGGLSGASCTH